MGRLENKVAIVTGGASGIGEQIVDLFCKEGAIVIAADINEEALKKAEQKENVYGIKLNVASDEEWENVAKEVKDRFGKIDVLVNNAGISSEKTYKDINLEDWQKMLAINGFGPFAGIKHVAPYMAEQKSGSIVNILLIQRKSDKDLTIILLLKELYVPFQKQLQHNLEKVV